MYAHLLAAFGCHQGLRDILLAVWHHHVITTWWMDRAVISTRPFFGNCTTAKSFRTVRCQTCQTEKTGVHSQVLKTYALACFAQRCSFVSGPHDIKQVQVCLT